VPVIEELNGTTLSDSYYVNHKHRSELNKEIYRKMCALCAVQTKE